jgi:hypothetical protein
MPNYEWSTRQSLADIHLGIRVDRAAVVAASGTNNIFTVTTGRVLLTGLLGEQTTLNDATASTLQISHLRTDVTTPVATVLSIASASTANATAGTMYSLPAAVGTALVTSVNNSAQILGLQPWGIVLTVGGLRLVVGVGATTGLIKWSVWYIPLDDGAYMTAA